MPTTAEQDERLFQELWESRDRRLGLVVTDGNRVAITWLSPCKEDDDADQG